MALARVGSLSRQSCLPRLPVVLEAVRSAARAAQSLVVVGTEMVLALITSVHRHGGSRFGRAGLHDVFGATVPHRRRSVGRGSAGRRGASARQRLAYDVTAERLVLGPARLLAQLASASHVGPRQPFRQTQVRLTPARVRVLPPTRQIQHDEDGEAGYDNGTQDDADYEPDVGGVVLPPSCDGRRGVRDCVGYDKRVNYRRGVDRVPILTWSQREQSRCHDEISQAG